MFSDKIRDILTILGIIVSLGGFAIAIRQIFKIKKVAIAAKEAALNARETLQTNIMLVDLSAHERVIDELKDFIRNKRYEAALIRISDTIAQLIQVRHMHCFSEEVSSISFQDMISRLSILRENLEGKIINPSALLDIILINKILSEIGIELNNLIGKSKFANS
jgi:hypothetical protein